MSEWRFPEVPTPPKKEGDSPAPEPAPQPQTAAPAPVPETVAAPVPETIAAPVPEPEPAPVPEPEPAPVPEAVAAPVPEAFAAPVPEPAPAAEPRPPTKRRWKRAIAIGLAVVFVGLLATGVWTGVRLAPWLRMPTEPKSEIDERWKVVSRLAAPPPKKGGQEALLEATKKIGTVDLDRGKGPTPLVPNTELSEEQHQAISALLRWHRTRGGYLGECALDPKQPGIAIPAYRLAKATLFTSSGVESLPRVEAVLAMGAELRRGGKLVELTVGATIAKMGAEWAQARGVMFPPAYERYRPNVDEIRGALARDAVCTLTLIDALKSPAYSIYDRRLGEPEQRPPFGIVRMERERVVFQQFHGRVLNEALAAGADWKRVSQIYERALVQRPKSVLLEASLPTASVIQSVGESMARYDQLVPRR
jgi:hypothetical protein